MFDRIVLSNFVLDCRNSEIEAFVRQQPALESQFRNLSQGLTKYIERYSDTYERDIQKISELFSKVHNAVQQDTSKSGSKELSSSIHKISESYNEIAESYKTKVRDIWKCVLSPNLSSHFEFEFGQIRIAYSSGCVPTIARIDIFSLDVFLRPVISWLESNI